jgi:hypothetical protein
MTIGLAALNAALTVFDHIHMAPHYTKATALRETILSALQTLTNS